MANRVVNNSQESRYELFVDDRLAGFAAYRITGTDTDTGPGAHTNIVFTHTEVDTDTFGHGLGGPLVEAALNDVRDNTDYRVVDRCPFVRKWISEHREYEELRQR
jgi:predicted GNAT family acetyltransferase